MKTLFWFLPSALVIAVFFCHPVWAQTSLTPIQSQASVVPVLELTVSQNAQSELKFGNITFSSNLTPALSEIKSVTLMVLSNMGVKYTVTQSISGALQNAQGQTIALENLKFRTIAQHGTGTAVGTFTPLATGSQTIFSSDAQGSGETVSAEYQLSVPPSQAPGDYSAFITYTVSSV